jgi:hypothetical protein
MGLYQCYGFWSTGLMQLPSRELSAARAASARTGSLSWDEFVTNWALTLIPSIASIVRIRNDYLICTNT